MSGQKTKFSVLCSLFGWMQKSKSTNKKRSRFRKYLDTFCINGDYFSSIRLILPSLDRERGSYGLKESILSLCLIDALGMSRDSDDAVRLINWRKGGAKIGANAGNFALVAAEVLQRRQGMISGGLTINDLNDLLDRLSSCENREQKVSILSTLIQKTNSQEMKWILMIILKDLKLGITEKSIFIEFHPDAEDMFNVTCDLRLVCETLTDRTKRSQRQDIEIGKAVRPQLAARVSEAASAWKKLQGKEVVVECKFDGDRIQMHKNGNDLHFFSRNFIDHSEYMPAISEIISQNINIDRCILDGEMLVWDNTLNRFADFGSNQEVAKAANFPPDPERQLCYVVFDILYIGDTSVIHRSLKERHEILQQIVKPVKGRLEIVIPDSVGDTIPTSTEPCRSFIAKNVDDVHRFFKETVDNRDEGIILKDLSSKWDPGDRSGKWLKLKPDYVRPGSDLDVLIIGGYYGSGRRGGVVTQFLVGLAEKVPPGTHPTLFISFCRVGSGLSDEELDSVVTKLRPYFQKYDYPKKTHPDWYKVTNHSKERPDVWVDNPKNSIILSITSDIRTTSSEVFAAPYCLRFPRIDRVRFDKLWYECLNVVSFVELVQSNNGTTRKLGESLKIVLKKKEKPGVSVPSHLVREDVSDIKSETRIFSKMVFYFLNIPPNYSLDFFHKMVVQNGGEFSMNLTSSVTHCIAAESRGGIKYRAAKLSGDIIHCSWLLDCFSQKRLVQLQPKYYIFLSDASKRRFHDQVDQFSDSYFEDIQIADIKQIFSRMEMLRHEDPKTIEYYRRKFCPKDEWGCFIGCCILFYTPMMNQEGDAAQVLLKHSLERMKLQVYRGGGRICESISESTHLVVFPTGSDINSEAILSSLGDSDGAFLRGGKIHVVWSQWVEFSLERNHRVEEDTYRLIPSQFSSDEEDSSQGCKNKRKRTPPVGGSSNSEIIQKGNGGTCQNGAESCVVQKGNTDNMYKKGLQNLNPQPGFDEKGGGSYRETVDPVEAMLLEMIPSLGGGNLDTRPKFGSEGEPVKKRRVSYKDTVKNIFEDW